MQLARRFHNDAVTDVRRVRRKRVVRWFRLAGHAEMPRTFEIDDELVVLERWLAGYEVPPGATVLRAVELVVHWPGPLNS